MIGTFLDSFPKILFVIIHLVLLGIGLWAVMKVSKLSWGKALWLYPIVHLGFLSYLFGWFTLKFAVSVEQVLLVIMIIWIANKAGTMNQM